MPEEFVRQVRDALAHLYDYPHLQTHALASAMESPASTTRLWVTWQCHIRRNRRILVFITE